MKQRYARTIGKLLPFLLPLVFIVIGFGSTFIDWEIFFDEGVFRPRMAFFGPLAGFLGLAMLIGPAALQDNLLETAAAARRRAQRQRLALTTFLVGLVLAGVNFALMNGWIGGLAG